VSGSTKLFIDGPAGKLQALWRSGGHPADFTKAVVLCHPHPLFGGTMENKVVARSARYISESGIEAIRFNFRGVDQSEGSFDNGNGEREDLEAVIAHVLKVSPGARLAVVGFSFGSFVALEVGARHPSVKALVGLAPALRMFNFEFLKPSVKPKLIVYAGKDQYTDAATTAAFAASLSEPVTSICIPDVDHFFGPEVDQVGHTVAGFVLSVL
jgi:uncharacterized protein